MGPKAEILQAATDIRKAEGLYDTAVNRLSGTISNSIFDPMYKNLTENVQNKQTGFVAQAVILENEAAQLPDDPPPSDWN